MQKLLTELTVDSQIGIEVTPNTLLVDGEEPKGPTQAVKDVAALLHAKDVLRLTFDTHVSKAELRALFGLLRMDIDTMRARGGPARIWKEVDCPTIGVEQLDYRALMERTGGGAGNASVERDDRWKTIVRSMLDGGTFDADAQQRIVAIANDPSAFEALVSDIQKPLCSADGSPILNAQAGAILDACRKVTEVVAARAPDAMLSVMQTVGKISSRLTPSVVEAILQLEDDLSDSDGDDNRVQMIAAMDETTLGAVIANVVTQEHGSTHRLERLLRILDKQSERSHELLAEARAALSRRLEDQPKRLETRRTRSSTGWDRSPTTFWWLATTTPFSRWFRC